jgi:hypothetical protein
MTAAAGLSEFFGPGEGRAGPVPLFGAQAAMLWGRPRLTADLDITVRLRPAQESEAISGFCRDMEEKGFRLRISDPEFLARTRVLPFLHTPTGLPLDIVLAGPGLEEAFISSPDAPRIGRTCEPC